MEINHYGDTILGVVPTEDIVEGRFVCLTSHSFDYDFGSKTDLPGCKLPDTQAEATRARYIITFAVDNRPTPIMDTIPSYTWALRQGGWDQAVNAPFAATVYLTHKSVQEGLTIPSGTASLAFGEGIYTLRSADYVYSAPLETPGCALSVCNDADDAAADSGKLKASTTNPVAEVVRYNSSTSKLTVKILH